MNSSTPPSEKPNSLETLFAAPARSAATTTVTAGAAFLALTPDVDAQIVYSVREGWGSVQASNFGWSGSNGATAQITWNVDQTGPAEFRIDANQRSSNSTIDIYLHPVSNGRMAWPGVTHTTGSGYNPTRQAANFGETIGSGMHFDGGWLGPIYGNNANWGFTEGTNYFGFRFNPSGSKVLYGWAQMNVTTGFDGGVVISEWAYQSSGGSIQVGAVPEPAAAATGLGLLALGAAGLRRQRRRQAIA